MQKLVLLQVLLATVIVPAITARDPNPVRALKRTLLLSFLFILWYGFSLIVVYPRVS